jgi:hypothetical protein
MVEDLCNRIERRHVLNTYREPSGFPLHQHSLDKRRNR